MSDFFNSKNNDPLLNRNTDFRTDNPDFSITGNTRENPPGSSSLLQGTTDPVLSASRQYLEDERIRRENQNAFFGVPRKQDTAPWNTGKQMQPDLYGNSIAEIQDRADPAKHKWNWSGKIDEMFKQRSGETARNAVLTGLQQMEQDERAELSQALLPKERQIPPGSVQEGWDNARDGLSFRAVETPSDRINKGRAPSIARIGDDMRAQAKRASLGRHDATGAARYQEGFHDAYLGAPMEDIIRQGADIHDSGPGIVWNQFALNGYAGTMDLPPVQIADTIPHGINKVSRALGYGNVVGTFSDQQAKLLEASRKFQKGDAFLTTPDGKNTSAGDVMEVGNSVARLLAPAGFALLMGGQGMDTGMIGAAFLAGEASSAYHSTEANALKHYDRMSLDMLMQDDHFRGWYQLYSQGSLDPVAVNLAKKEAAAQRAADEAGVQIILNLAMQKVDKLVPEERPSALLDFFREMAKGGVAAKLGEIYRSMLQMGPVIDEGHGW